MRTSCLIPCSLHTGSGIVQRLHSYGFIMTSCWLLTGRCGVFLALLDLSATFDTVDHTILIDFLKLYIGIDGTAFNLLQSYLLGRNLCVSIEGVLSEVSELPYRVPQSSVLGPIQFCIQFPWELSCDTTIYNIIFMRMTPNCILSDLSKVC